MKVYKFFQCVGCDSFYEGIAPTQCCCMEGPTQGAEFKEFDMIPLTDLRVVGYTNETSLAMAGYSEAFRHATGVLNGHKSDLFPIPLHAHIETLPKEGKQDE